MKTKFENFNENTQSHNKNYYIVTALFNILDEVSLDMCGEKYDYVCNSGPDFNFEPEGIIDEFNKRYNCDFIKIIQAIDPEYKI